MKIIVCIDENFGMMFNGRRQSKDRVVREKIYALSKGSKLFMNNFSHSQFEEKYDNIIVDEEFLKKAEKDDFCFVEDKAFLPSIADMLYVFCWNRLYPNDFALGFNIEESGFRCIQSVNFEGYSHKNITLNIYERVESDEV